MKIKNLFIVLLIISIGVLLTSCYSERDDTNILLEPELFTDFSISDGNIMKPNNSDVKKVKPGIKITWSIGRKSKNCAKFGLCKITHVTIILTQKNSPVIGGSEITTTLKNINDEYFILINMDTFLDPEIYDTNFYIDEDVLYKDITINSGVFVLDNSLGDFGGYKIPVILNN